MPTDTPSSLNLWNNPVMKELAEEMLRETLTPRPLPDLSYKDLRSRHEEAEKALEKVAQIEIDKDVEVTSEADIDERDVLVSVELNAKSLSSVEQELSNAHGSLFQEGLNVYDELDRTWVSKMQKAFRLAHEMSMSGGQAKDWEFDPKGWLVEYLWMMARRDPKVVRLDVNTMLFKSAMSEEPWLDQWVAHLGDQEVRHLKDEIWKEFKLRLSSKAERYANSETVMHKALSFWKERFLSAVYPKLKPSSLSLPTSAEPSHFWRKDWFDIGLKDAMEQTTSSVKKQLLEDLATQGWQLSWWRSWLLPTLQGPEKLMFDNPPQQELHDKEARLIVRKLNAAQKRYDALLDATPGLREAVERATHPLLEVTCASNMLVAVLSEKCRPVSKETNQIWYSSILGVSRLHDEQGDVKDQSMSLDGVPQAVERLYQRAPQLGSMFKDMLSRHFESRYAQWVAADMDISELLNPSKIQIWCHQTRMPFVHSLVSVLEQEQLNHRWGKTNLSSTPKQRF